MNKVLPLIVCFIAATAYAQDTAKAPVEGWKHTLVAGVTMTQVAFTDWSQGGENALAYGTLLDGKSVQELQATNWSTTYKFAFGQTRLGDQGLRKTDDRIDIQTVLTYKLNAYVNPYASASFLTQFARGYKYNADGTKFPLSKFLDPGYFTQSAGAGTHIIPEVRTRLGVGVREIVTSEFRDYADGKKTKVDGGMESVTDIEWKLEDNILFTSNLQLFSAFRKMDEVIVRNGNTVAMKVNKYITVNFNVQLINEKAVTPRTQVLESLAVGLSYTLL